MYVPAHFAEEDESVLYSFMQEHPFATLVTNTAEGPIATHLPVDVDTRDEAKHGRILGHVARANPHWQKFQSNENSLLIFHGPHNYISPAWYKSGNLVPTWNYAAVHAYGRLVLINEPADVRALLDRLVQRFESERSSPWINPLKDDFMNQLQAAIVAFEFRIDHLEGKFKLSQNRMLADQIASLAGLEQEGGDASLAALTRRRLDEK
jgi:transcriptional regulator